MLDELNKLNKLSSVKAGLLMEKAGIEAENK
jgi:hypothetical protein